MEILELVEGEASASDLTTLKAFIEDYLKGSDISVEVRQYLEKVKKNDGFLTCYIQGRKNIPIRAWETLRKYAENRFKHYPEAFPTDFTVGYKTTLRPLLESHVFGTLKSLDKFGRRILFLDMSKWDPQVTPFKAFSMAAVLLSEMFWRRPEILEKGELLIKNTQGFGIAHARQLTPSQITGPINICLHSYPVSVKGYFMLNAPYLFVLVGRMLVRLLPAKLQSRAFIYSAKEMPTGLHEMASQEILPTWAGGNLEIEEAAEELSFYDQLLLSCDDDS